MSIRASSTIRAIGYSEPTKQLWVDFLSGATRVYEGVGLAEFRRLLSTAAASKGQYQAELMRDR
jgi:hypothetical protein